MIHGFEGLTNLVTLLSKDHEIQYVALRNIRLLLQQEPSVCLTGIALVILKQILKGEMKAFFVQYNDPVYVQVEKIESMIMLASNDNIDVVLGELTETTEKVWSAFGKIDSPMNCRLTLNW